MKSRKEISDTQLDSIFTKRYKTDRFVWTHPYPLLYLFNLVDIPFEIYPNLFYLSSFEQPVSTMETQSIAGQNVANLIAKRLNKK